MTARGVDPKYLKSEGKNASAMSSQEFSNLCYDAKHVISI